MKTNVTPIRPGVIGIGAGELMPREVVGRAVVRLVAEGRSGSVRLWIGSAQIGRVDVHEGRVRHAEIPGAQGDAALGLVPRLSGVQVVIEPYQAVPSTVTLDWKQVLDPDGALERDGLVPRAERSEGFAELFREATAAYVARRYDDAQALFERCAELEPDDRRVAHNLERLRARRR